jgi:hypothetical protein
VILHFTFFICNGNGLWVWDILLLRSCLWDWRKVFWLRVFLALAKNGSYVHSSSLFDSDPDFGFSHAVPLSNHFSFSSGLAVHNLFRCSLYNLAYIDTGSPNLQVSVQLAPSLEQRSQCIPFHET